MENKLLQYIIKEVRRRMVQESMMKLQSCLDKLTLEQIWYRPNENTLSIGNTLLHLNGNVRQYILAGLAGGEDTRQRSKEFSERSVISKEDLLNPLKKTMQEVDQYLDKLDIDELTIVRPVQCFDESGVGILIHVVEHFSYHVGQVVYITKMLEDQDMGFYDGLDLEQKGM
jgi:uncharacterized damage-inducible protein DinB